MIPSGGACRDPDKVMPIAIIGVGGRFPGDAADPDKLWNMLAQGRNALTKTPGNRYNIDAFYHPHAEQRGAQHFTGGNFMDRAPDAFDAPFFSITPSEAKAMDPQQRMCLEVAFEALENAGVRLEDIRGSQTSVYVGAFTKDYRTMMARDPDNLPWYFATGIADACLSNRVSWFYDLRGPSMTIDTACSSSLVALHLACQSLRTGESQMALVGGVNFICFPEYNVTMSTMHFMSADSKCQTFDSKGNGYGRGEGCSFVVLKPLDAALRDGDVIRAVIRNTGCNQDGNTPGLALPSGEAQAALIRRVYDDAGLSMADTGYFEAHGTGTAAGDPIEAKALGDTIGAARRIGDPLWVGSVKASIGHLEGASGLAGLTKALYILEKASIPPQVWLETVNPRIHLEKWNLAVPDRLMPWPKQGLRRISINSFGFGGANAHVILDDAYHYLTQRGLQGRHNTLTDLNARPASLSSDSAILLDSPSVSSEDEYRQFDHHGLQVLQSRLSPPQLLVWSAHEQSGVDRIAASYSSYLCEKMETLLDKDHDEILHRLTYTHAKHRTILPWKSFAIAADLKEMAGALTVPSTPVRSSKAPKIGFVFTGQGAQWFAMGRELLAYHDFLQSLRDASVYLLAQGCQWSLIDEFLRDEHLSNINLPEYSQSICTALQIALVDLLTRWDIRPAAVIGHSSGEIAAAYAKGAISREAGWKIAYERGRWSGKIVNLAPELNGAMLAAGISMADATDLVSCIDAGKVSIACINSPSSVTLSGDRQGIEQAEALLRRRDKFARRLKVSTAYHSDHMQIIASQYLDAISDIETLPDEAGQPHMFSTVTTNLVQNSTLDPQYWLSNMLSTVQFGPALEKLVSHSDKKRRRTSHKPFVDVLIEIGPHAALQGPVNQILNLLQMGVQSMSLIHRKQNAACTTLEVIGRLFQCGYSIDLEAVNRNGYRCERQQHLVDLPPFPWNHNNSYWAESALAQSHRFRKHARDDLIGLRTDECNDERPSWRHFLRLSENPWLEDHSVHNTLLYPACGMIAMVLQAAAQMSGNSGDIEGYKLRDIVVSNALIVPHDEEGVEVMMHFQPWRNRTRDTTADWKEFTIFSRPGKEDWSRNCTGLIKVCKKGKPSDGTFANEAALANERYRQQYQLATIESHRVNTPQQFYKHQHKIGVQLGRTFQNVIEMWKGPGQSVCKVMIPDLAAIMPMNHLTEHVIHPCVLDSIITTLMPAVEGEVSQLKTAAIPTYIEQLFISADIPSTPGTIFQTYSIASHVGAGEAEGCVYASVEGWPKPLIMFERVRATRLSELQPASRLVENDIGLRKIAGELDWQVDVSHMDNHAVQAHCNHHQQPLSQLAAYIKLLAHKNPSMKILEIDVGDGKIAESILQSLIPEIDNVPLFHSYTMTDIDQEAVENPVIEVDDHASRLLSKKLDILRDPLQQGFAQEAFDVVIASNLAESALPHARLLLKPGGKMIIANVVSQKLLDSLIFGTIDNNLSFPILSVERWDTIFLRSGFSGIEVAFPHTKDTKLQPFAFFVATLLPPAIDSLPTDVVIVQLDVSCDASSDLASELTNSLRACGCQSMTITLGALTDEHISNKSVVVLAETETPLLFDLNDKDFQQVRNIILGAERTTWVTRGGAVECHNPKLGLVAGFARTIRSEKPGIKLNTVDLDPFETLCSSINVNAIMKVLQAHHIEQGDFEFAIRDGILKIPRIRVEKGANDLIAITNADPRPELMALKQPGRTLTLALETPGMLETLCFRDDETWQNPLAHDDVEIEVKASGLNFMDVMVAMGQIREPALGLECSGIVSRVGRSVTRFQPGDRVMTWMLGAIGSFVRNHESMIQPIPRNMNFSVAASLPMIFTTAYASLIEEARLEKNEKILVHAAAGGVGQAAIQIAQHIGAEVFATVGSDAKKMHIMQEFGIPSDHIFNSRDLSFVDGVKRMTHGEGVDVVLNCLAGEAMKASWQCLGWFGRLIELGKIDIEANAGLDMAVFAKNTSFHAVNIIGTLGASVRKASKLFQKTMNFINIGYARPISPVTVMSFSQIEQGFRLLQSGKLIGKIVFQAGDHDIVPAIPRKIRKATLNSEATYLLSGGLGGVGRSISQWMAEHGAKNMVFLSRSGARSPSAKTHIENLTAAGVNVRVYECDVGNAEAVQKAAHHIAVEMPPIRGIVQAAMSLADAAYVNMTSEQWKMSLRPKTSGSWNLHEVFGQEVDFFIMLASSSGIVGNPGQSNYAAGNTFQDALAHYRRSHGYKGTAIDLGPVLGSGHVAENMSLMDSLARQGAVALRTEEVLALVQAAITGQTVPGHTMPAQLITGFATGGYAAAQRWEIPPYFDDAKFHHILEVDLDISTLAAKRAMSWQSQLDAVASLSDAAELVAEALRLRLAKFMMVSADDIDLHKPVSAYGVDSLTAVELGAWSFRELQSEVSIFDIMSNVPLHTLARTIVSKSKFVPKAIIDADQ